MSSPAPEFGDSRAPDILGQAEAKMADGARSLHASHARGLAPADVAALADAAHRAFAGALILFKMGGDADSARGALSVAAEALMRQAHARVLGREYGVVFEGCYKPAVDLLKQAQEEIDAALAAHLAAAGAWDDSDDRDGPLTMGIAMALDEAAAQRRALDARIAELTAALERLREGRDVVRAKLGAARWRRGNPFSDFAARHTALVNELRAATILREQEAALDAELPRPPDSAARPPPAIDGDPSAVRA